MTQNSDANYNLLHSRGDQRSERSVAVVITTYNDPKFLQEALASIQNQQQPADEIIVVDDGSDVSPAAIVSQFAGAILFRQKNGGLAAARNTGLKLARSRFISFLDADDRLLPPALATGLACIARNPGAGMVYGGYRRIRADGKPIGTDQITPVSNDPYADLLSGNCIGMHACVLYQREVLLSLGGFDTTLPMCEDYDVYLRMARAWPIASHDAIIAEYRWHGRNMSLNSGQMLQSALRVHSEHKDQSGVRRQAWHAGQQKLQQSYRKKGKSRWSGIMTKSNVMRKFDEFAQALRRRLRTKFRGGVLHRIAVRTGRFWPPAFKSVRFGDLGSTRPISQDFGWDRGTPIDRYYIESFLKQCSADIAGRVLEVADDMYSSRFGGARVKIQDVIHLDRQGAKITIVGDLTRPGVLPEDTYDCIIVTQTLQMIFNLDEAVQRLHAALKVGGVLLLTVPGITALERGGSEKLWYWSFTDVSIASLFEKMFEPAMMHITSHGNVFAAIALLAGVAMEEVPRPKLDVRDVAYPVIITMRAEKK